MKLIDACYDITVQHVASVRQVRHFETLPASLDRDSVLAHLRERIPRYDAFLRTVYDQMLVRGTDAPLGDLETEFYELAWSD